MSAEAQESISGGGAHHNVPAGAREARAPLPPRFPRSGNALSSARTRAHREISGHGSSEEGTCMKKSRCCGSCVAHGVGCGAQKEALPRRRP